MNLEHHKQQLLQKEQELLDELAQSKQNALESRTAEVEDPIDAVISSEAQAAALHGASFASETLEAVRDALKRIENDTYGICIECDKPIEPARLEAVPWTPYCLADQEAHDKAAALQSENALDAIS